ncbi:MAG: DNA repair protein RecN [Lachnospiraceae bacterium]|nr:DNA repair protein RecN [Lachnospiraceae bacterium]
MLLSLHVKNFAIIDEVYVDFGPGMNILTGETGAGKSILLGSVNAALGGKVSKEMLGRNADYALAELIFDGEDEAVRELLESHEIPVEENLIISRRIADNGRSISRVNGEVVNTGFLKELSERLLEVYGQRENQTLLDTKNQLRLVDRFAKEKTGPLLSEIRTAYSAYRQTLREFEEARSHAESRTRELSLLRYEHEEIERANPKPGEDTELEERYRILSNRSRLLEAAGEADRLLCTDSDSAADLVGRTLRQMGRVLSYDTKLDDIYREIEQVEQQLRDIGAGLSDYVDNLDSDAGELAETEERLNLLNRLKAKYGKTVEDIRGYDKDLVLKIDRLENFDRYLEELKGNVRKQEKKLADLCGRLGEVRREAAGKLEVKIHDALTDLNFPDVIFRIAIEDVPMTGDGTESAEFMISVNPGEPVRPLAKIASGGELSRISLAVKSVFAGKDEIETLILDEIDTGVSGRTAQKVAEKMAAIAKEHQILCITHLPQIAAFASKHFLIEKATDGTSTKTGVTPLNEEQTVKELARMLSGAQITDSVMANAKEMRALAKEKGSF